ncbi:11471_t:CDS:2 [Ambispora gerdemannii]|uniref:11471_t:CDS:1 n=1 Tax=Ambispora gerdemannii TaxID=144530 RepID=A0A9N9FF60_9GLOM|nr:11471_t:CDS:2 [Ambispora gerdemannii]
MNNHVKRKTSKTINNDINNSPTSTIRSKFSLPLRKSSPNISRPKSDTSIPNLTFGHPPKSTSTTNSEQTIENQSTSHRSNTTPLYIGRCPSTPTLRNFHPSSKNDLPSIKDDSITTPSVSPSNSSISSSDTTNEDEYEAPLDITTFLAAPRLTQRVRLKSGRVLSFSEVGDRNGFPVFVFLGMGCVRYFIAFFDDLASSYGLRLICPDRPGVGLSDNVKVEEQQVLKWPVTLDDIHTEKILVRLVEVIEELCDIMSINKFFIMAHSAGAPYALACALKMPERLQGTVYLVCPWVSTAVANNFKWLRYVPTPIMKFTNTAGISLQQMLYGRQPYATKTSSHRSSGALASPLSSLDKKQRLGLAILKASFAENLAGANNDLLMCFERRHAFGFSYTDINHPVHVFHGTKDERIPVSAVKWMKDEMPQCKLTLIPGGKHSLLLRAEVVDTIFKSIAVQLHVEDECRKSSNRRRSLPLKIRNSKSLKFNSRKSTGKVDDLVMSTGKSEENQVPKIGEKLVSVYNCF